MVELIERFGVSLGLLIVLIITLFKVGRWIGPRIDKWVDAQIKLTNTLRDKVNTITNNLEQQTQSLHMLVAKTENLSESIRSICKHSVDNEDGA